MRADYERPGGLQIVEIAGGYQIVTRPELHEWVRKLFHERTTQKLSVQALETLAVIAYKQPVTAPEIAEIRGVSSSGGVLSTLVERHLIKTVGRKQVVGRPFMYATTREFLDRFGLNDLTDLPKVEEMSDALGFELPIALAEPTVDDDAAAVRAGRRARARGARAGRVARGARRTRRCTEVAGSGLRSDQRPSETAAEAEGRRPGLTPPPACRPAFRKSSPPRASRRAAPPRR